MAAMNLLHDTMTSPLPLSLVTLHSRPIATPETCAAAYHHDRTAEILSLAIIIGLVASYLPQHYRIIHNKNSEGFSPFFLLLGATSSASSLLNMIALQWGQVACCQYLTTGQCFESVLGIGQVFVQWFCFNLIFVLALIYYPRSGKYVRSLPLDNHSIPPELPWSAPFKALVPAFMRTSTPAGYVRSHRGSDASDVSDASSNSSFDPRGILLPGQVRHSTIILSPEYRRSLSLFVLTLLHLFLTALTTAILLVTLPKAPLDGTPPAFPGSGREHPSERAVRVWATTLGLSSVILGCLQYFPQIILTARRKLVGSLSIPMMLLQTPGSFVFVYTLAVRPGVNWSGWATYFVTGILQGLLLILCISWKARQKRLGIDDWGVSKQIDDAPVVAPSHRASRRAPGERTALLS